MGTMIHLSAGNLNIDWGKNNYFFDHSPMYQTGDVTDIPSWFVKDHRNNDDNWTLYADYKEGYASPLWKVIERLNLLGYTINVAQKQYNLDIEENTYEGSPPIPSFEVLKELFASCDVSLLVDDERQINRRLDKDFIQHAKECRREEFINQKLSYMHENPCNGVWNLARSPSEYLHSSAPFYDTGKHSIYEVTNYKELEDINLTER